MTWGDASERLGDVANRVLRAARARPFDLACLLLSLAFAAPSLGYRFGRDQALFAYFGREWWAGGVPYRDFFDMKPPGIYLVNALTSAVWGSSEWGIRLVDVSVVLASGVLAGALVRSVVASADGILGPICLMLVGWHYCLFDFWDSAQAEQWEALLLLGSYFVALRSACSRRRAFWAGLLLGAACTFKPTASVVGVIPAVVVVWRATAADGTRLPPASPERAVRLLVFSAGGAVPATLFFVYFAAQDGGLAALGDLWRYWQSYVDWAPLPPSEAVRRVRSFWFTGGGLWLAGFGAAWLSAVISAVRSRRSELLAHTLVALLLVGAALTSVGLQRKYYSYHWGVASPFLVLAAGYGVALLRRVLAAAASVGLCLAGFLTAPRWIHTPGELSYQTYTTRFLLPYLTGALPRARFFEVFRQGNYSYTNTQAIAAAIAERARPGDLLHARGFELGIYTLTGLRSPCRFVNEEIAIDQPALGWNHEQWQAQQNGCLSRVRPRFVVGFRDRHRDLAFLRSLGYVSRTSAGLLVLLEQRRPS